MDFEHFASARDFFYLAALFFGAGLGSVLNRFRRNFPRGRNISRFRNRSVTAGLCFFSGTVAALTAACVFSNWIIFTDVRLYIPFAVLVALPALAVRFPRAAGFPLILAAGVMVVWIGYTWLRLPAFDGNIRNRVTRDGAGLIYLRLVSSSGTEREAYVSFAPTGDDSVLEFRALRFSFSETFPLVGGLHRGVITEVRSNDALLYTDPRFGINNGPPLDFMPFILSREISGNLRTATLLPGADLTVFFEGSALTFR